MADSNSYAYDGNGKVRVLLYQQDIPTRMVPLGLAYLAAVLESSDCDVKILNAAAPYIQCDVTTLRDTINEFRPHIFGISLTTPYVRLGYAVLDIVSQYDGLIKVTGGPHATLRPEESIENGADLVVIGEGEETICDLVNCVRKNGAYESVEGICYRSAGGEILRTAPRIFIGQLDDMPFPARHLFNREDYISSPSDSVRFGPIVTSRGCPVGCAFCSNAIFGKKYRFRSPENVLAELKECHDLYGVKHFIFVDDVFTLPPARADELCDLIIEDTELDISWSCLAILKSMSPELLEKMKRAGCTEIAYGIESANIDTLKKIHKPLDPDLAREVLKWTSEAGIDVEACFILGYPWEDDDDVYRTLGFMKEIKPYVSYYPNSNLLVPYPGTELYDLYKDEYGFEDWWLNKDGFNADYRSDVGLAFYQRIYYDDRGQLKKGCSFFSHSPSTWGAIKACVDFVGSSYLDRFPKRVTNNTLLQKILKLFGVILVRFSLLIYSISPRCERILFSTIYQFGSRVLRFGRS